MTSVESASVEPDLALARQTAQRAHAVIVKLKEMGLPDDLDGDLASLSTDLGDLWGAQSAFESTLVDLLESAGEWEALGDALVDLRATMDHILWHVKKARAPAAKIARYAYRQG